MTLKPENQLAGTIFCSSNIRLRRAFVKLKFLDIEYGPGLVKRLREKFTQMAKQSGSTIVATGYKRFSSMDDIVSSECSETGVSQTLPRMK